MVQSYLIDYETIVFPLINSTLYFSLLLFLSFIHSISLSFIQFYSLFQSICNSLFHLLFFLSFSLLSSSLLISPSLSLYIYIYISLNFSFSISLYLYIYISLSLSFIFSLCLLFLSLSFSRFLSVSLCFYFPHEFYSHYNWSIYICTTHIIHIKCCI